MITMADIATKAGVSRSTVSLVLNQRHEALRISDETRLRILYVAEELGYRRNELARAVVTGQSHVLGLMTSSPESESSARVLAGALDEAEEHGFFVKVLRLRNDVELDAATLERCLEMRLCGLLVMYLRGKGLPTLRAALRPYHLPVVVADDASERQKNGAHILSDYEAGMEQAVEHLYSLGHRHIALMTGLHTGELPAREREAAFRNAMRRRNLKVPSGFIVSRFEEAPQAEITAQEMLQLPNAPTAIIAGTDLTGLVIQRAARRLNLQVPHDLSVIGFGSPRLAEWADPPLTLVAQPFYEIGRVAVRQLLQRLPRAGQKWSDSLLLERLPTELTVRASTAPVMENPPG